MHTQKHHTHAALRSCKWRKNMQLTIMNEFFFGPVEIVNQEFMQLSHLPVPKSDVVVSQMYKRDETFTIVNVLRKGGRWIVCKIFKVSESNRAVSSSSALVCEEHEIEIRYLVILSDLVSKGKMEGCVIPFGYICVPYENLIGSRLVKKHQREMILSTNNRGKSGKGFYAVIFAEAADYSLTEVILKQLVPEAQVNDIFVRSICFQICFILSYIQLILPSFRHNDAHTSNILVQVFDPNIVKQKARSEGYSSETFEAEYRFVGRRWRLDLLEHPYRCMLWDMAFSSIQAKDMSACGIECVVPKKSMFGKRRHLDKTNLNQSADLYKIIDTLRKLLERRQIAVSEQVSDIIERLAPRRYSPLEENLSENEKDIRTMKLVHGDYLLMTPHQALVESDMFNNFEYMGGKSKPFYVVFGDHSDDNMTTYQTQQQ